MIENWKKRTLWLLISLTIYFSGFSIYTRNFIRFGTEIPPLIFPLQQIRASGRILSVAFILIIIIFSYVFIRVNKKDLININYQVNYWRDLLVISLIIIHLLVIFKLFQGFTTYEIEFFSAVISELFFLLVVMTIALGPSKIITTKDDFRLAVQSISISVALFVFSNFAQLLVNEPALYYAGNNIFLGTTGNPQHAASLLVMSLPSVLYSYQQKTNKLLIKLVWFLTIILTIYFCYETGSRTGFIALCFSLLLYFSSRVKFIHWLLFFGSLAFIIPEWYNIQGAISDAPVNKLTTFNIDSREGNWGRAWREFNDYFLFGVPLADRPIYIESSWLALYSTLGSVGFLISLLWLIYFYKQVVFLSQIIKSGKEITQEANLVRVIFVNSFILSLGEANLLGIISPFILILLLNIALLKFIINYDQNSITTNKARTLSYS